MTSHRLVAVVLLSAVVHGGAFLSSSDHTKKSIVGQRQPPTVEFALRYPYQYDDEVAETEEEPLLYDVSIGVPDGLTGGDCCSEEEECVNVDALRARAGVLRRTILQQQQELQQVERKIICCSRSSTDSASSLNDAVSPAALVRYAVNQTYSTFQASSSVLWRKLQRVQGSVGVHNHKWKGSVGDFCLAQTHSGVRIVDKILHNQTQLLQLVKDPSTPTLVPHVPAILARLDKLEGHMAPILERVLNNQRHLASIEPYLPEILERFDDIEPHLPWILDHIDILAPYTGLLLQHIDELLPYAALDEYENLHGRSSNYYQYALAEQLLPYLEFYVSRLDTVGPHLPLLRPHVPKLLKHNRIAKMSPHIDRLFALGYKDNLGASANMDVLLFWFGWALRVPGLPRLFFAIPGSPRIVTFLANRLPKRFVRGYCSGISCTVDGDYGVQWNKLSKEGAR
ncbi:expressed unknown protein [Seminavis robusta]|uniref:Secreted protein n=1 Tax=Seminavis robusta TaxID=568900 RepID=A0A9N8HRU2_9STRA|nr:expressed unknown protein [Seminavis robusta]|eukprot:Sro1359_g265960.1 n/a (454) ;mRNA; f:9582-10943